MTEEVLLALRVLVRAGIVDWNGHASRRVEGGFSVNAAEGNRAALGEGDLSTVSLEGDLLAGPRAPNEAHLHAAIYRARPDVGAVVHGHPRFLGALSSAGAALAPVTPQAAALGRVPTYRHAHSISTRGRGEAVAGLLGTGRAALLRSHGIVAVGPDLPTACALAIYAEEAAERMVLAAPLGGAEALTDEEAEEYARTLLSPALVRKVWDFTLAKGA